MTADPDCIFCRIVKGEIPCFRVYEDDDVLGFMDINPFNEGHALAIPKAHHPDLGAIPPELAGKVAAAAVRIGRAVGEVIRPDGMNLLQANGPAAGQSVFHFHIHIFPRVEGDNAHFNWEYRPGDMERIGALAEKIAAAVRRD